MNQDRRKHDRESVDRRRSTGEDVPVLGYAVAVIAALALLVGTLYLLF